MLERLMRWLKELLGRHARRRKTKNNYINHLEQASSELTKTPLVTPPATETKVVDAIRPLPETAEVRGVSVATNDAPESQTILRRLETNRLRSILEGFQADTSQTDYMDFINYVSSKSSETASNTRTSHERATMLEKKSGLFSKSSQRTETLSQLTERQRIDSYSSILEGIGTVSPMISRPIPQIDIKPTEHLFIKLALIGDGAVGKTSLRRAYLGQNFKSEYLMTIGADFALSTVEIDNVKIKYQIWDLAGQERFSTVRSVYYSGALGALIVFDQTRPETFSSSVLLWLNELWRNSTKGPVPFVLLGNKSDLAIAEEIEVVQNRARRLMNTFNAETLPRKGFEVKFFSTSAKTGENVAEAFDFLGRQILSWMEARKKKRAELRS